MRRQLWLQYGVALDEALGELYFLLFIYFAVDTPSFKMHSNENAK